MNKQQHKKFSNQPKKVEKKNARKPTAQEEGDDEQVQQGLQAMNGKRMGLGFDESMMKNKTQGVQKKIIKKKDLVDSNKQKEEKEQKAAAAKKKKSESQMGKVVGFVDADSESDEETSKSKSIVSKKDKFKK